MVVCLLERERPVDVADLAMPVEREPCRLWPASIRKGKQVSLTRRLMRNDALSRAATHEGTLDAAPTLAPRSHSVRPSGSIKWRPRVRRAGTMAPEVLYRNGLGRARVGERTQRRVGPEGVTVKGGREMSGASHRRCRSTVSPTYPSPPADQDRTARLGCRSRQSISLPGRFRRPARSYRRGPGSCRDRRLLARAPPLRCVDPVARCPRPSEERERSDETLRSGSTRLQSQTSSSS
jgi:hypothetical protein